MLLWSFLYFWIGFGSSYYTFNNVQDPFLLSSTKVKSVAFSQKQETQHGISVNDTYVVNLQSRTDRWTIMQKTLSTSHVLSHMNVQRMDAVVGRTVDFSKLYREGILAGNAYRNLLSSAGVEGQSMTVGSVGCLLSHVAIWKKVVEMQKPVLVLEDDVLFTSELDMGFNNIIRDAPLDFGMIYLADLANTENSNKHAHNYRKSTLNQLTGHYWGTYGYIISPSAALILLDNLYPLKVQVDTYIIETCTKFGVKVFRSKVNLVTTDNSPKRDTDVQRTSGTTPRIVPTVHVLAETSPFHVAPMNVHTFLHEVEIEVWDSNKILAEHSLAQIVDGPAHLTALKVLRLQLSILFEQGGTFNAYDAPVSGDIEPFLTGVGGMITLYYHADGSLSFPMVYMRSGLDWTLAAGVKLDALITKYSTVSKNKKSSEKDNNIFLEWLMFLKEKGVMVPGGLSSVVVVPHSVFQES